MISLVDTKMEGIESKENLSYDDCFVRMYPGLCVFAEKFVGDCAIAEDLVQNVFMTLWECFNDFDSQVVVKAYLYRSVRNSCLNHIKHENVKSRFIKEQFNAADFDQCFFREMIHVETHRILQEALDELPDQCRKIFLLSTNGLKNREIAEDLHLSVNTVKNQKRIAQDKLRSKLDSILPILSFIFWVW